LKFEGTVKINAPREKVWSCLTDPNLVSQCAPGLQSLEILVPDKIFKVIASIGFGSVRVTFDTDVEWVELIPPREARVKAHGKAPGSGVDVTSAMRLVETQDSGTEMNWTADVVVMGSIAGLASRLMGGVTKKLSESFFECIKAKIEA